MDEHIVVVGAGEDGAELPNDAAQEPGHLATRSARLVQDLQGVRVPERRLNDLEALLTPSIHVLLEPKALAWRSAVREWAEDQETPLFRAVSSGVHESAELVAEGAGVRGALVSAGGRG